MARRYPAGANLAPAREWDQLADVGIAVNTLRPRAWASSLTQDEHPDGKPGRDGMITTVQARRATAAATRSSVAVSAIRTWCSAVGP